MTYQIISILDSILSPGRVFTGGEHYYYCPFCHHYNPKLAVNINKGKWQCWKCGARGGTLLSLLRKLDVSKDQIRQLATLLQEELPKFQTDTVEATLMLPREFLPLWEPSSRLEYRHALHYLKLRAITSSDILKYQLGYCVEGKYQNRIIIPSFDVTGQLNYFVGRRFYDGGLNYINPPISKNVVGFEAQINWNYPIVLGEGVFDAMAIKRNAIPLFGKTISAKLKKTIVEQGVKEVYIALDYDALKESIKIIEYFMQQDITVYRVELSSKDPAELGSAAMHHLIKTAMPITFIELMQLKMRLC